MKLIPTEGPRLELLLAQDPAPAEPCPAYDRGNLRCQLSAWHEQRGAVLRVGLRVEYVCYAPPHRVHLLKRVFLGHWPLPAPQPAQHHQVVEALANFIESAYAQIQASLPARLPDDYPWQAFAAPNPERMAIELLKS